MGGPSGAGADGVQFGDVLRVGQQEGHGAKGAAEVVEVQSGDDDPNARIGQPVADVHDGRVEELDFIDADDGGGLRRAKHGRLELVGGGHCDGLLTTGIVAHHIGGVVAVVLDGLEQEHVLLGKDGAADAAEQFFGLAGEHGARDDLEGAADGMGWVPFVCRHDVSILRRRSTAAKSTGRRGPSRPKSRCGCRPRTPMGNVEPQGFGGHRNCHYIRTPNFPGFFNSKRSGYVELQDRLRQ